MFKEDEVNVTLVNSTPEESRMVLTNSWNVNERPEKGDVTHDEFIESVVHYAVEFQGVIEG